MHWTKIEKTLKKCELAPCWHLTDVPERYISRGKFVGVPVTNGLLAGRQTYVTDRQHIYKGQAQASAEADPYSLKALGDS